LLTYKIQICRTSKKTRTRGFGFRFGLFTSAGYVHFLFYTFLAC